MIGCCIKKPGQHTNKTKSFDVQNKITKQLNTVFSYGFNLHYSFLQVGLVYMFNLIVGTGALTMPKAFATAGWVVSLALISFLGFMR